MKGMARSTKHLILLSATPIIYPRCEYLHMKLVKVMFDTAHMRSQLA